MVHQNTSKKKKEKLTKNLINQNTSKKKKEKLTKVLINEQQATRGIRAHEQS